MEFSAHIEISTYYEPLPNVMVLTYTAHFQQLIRLFAPSCNFFELNCWREETKVLQDAEQKIRSKGILKKIDHPTYTPVRLISELSPTIVDELLMKPFDEYGRVKWFSLFLGKTFDLTFERNTENTIILELSHWGKEIHMFRMSEEELKDVQSIFSCLHEEDIRFHYEQMT